LHDAPDLVEALPRLRQMFQYLGAQSGVEGTIEKRDPSDVRDGRRMGRERPIDATVLTAGEECPVLLPSTAHIQHPAFESAAELANGVAQDLSRDEEIGQEQQIKIPSFGDLFHAVEDSLIHRTRHDSYPRPSDRPCRRALFAPARGARRLEKFEDL